jgi:hypothetical protein
LSASLRVAAFLATLPLLGAAAPSRATVHHAVTTENESAQRYFDEALTLYYAYNGAEAEPLFDRAVSLDPHLAMGYYGVALAAGPDLNSPLTMQGFKRAATALAKARSLESFASQSERAYIDALSQRYAHQFKDREADDARYRARMAELAERYSGDDDALTLYAEALLEQTGRGGLWNSDDTRNGVAPKPRTHRGQSFVDPFVRLGARCRCGAALRTPSCPHELCSSR